MANAWYRTSFRYDAVVSARIEATTGARDIRRLERELGQRLAHRPSRLNPITRLTGLTDHGCALANGIATVLRQAPGLARAEITRLPNATMPATTCEHRPLTRPRHKSTPTE